MLKFYVTDIDDNTRQIKNIVSFELSKSIDAACDGLRLNFVNNEPMDEIVKVAVYNDEQIIFNGYADTQRETSDENGYVVFIYARSCACLLTDNEAKPVTYTCPSAQSLYYQNARQFGFDCDLPKLYCNFDYQVGKGVSCYGAINDFVCGITGYNIIVGADNVIRLPSQDTLHNIANKGVVSEKRVINRGDAITTVDYKANGDNSYDHHLKSRFLEQRKINTSQKINLSTLPNWQREYTAKNRLLSGCQNYYTLELVLADYIEFGLYDKVCYTSKKMGQFDDYYISKIVVKSDKTGTTTKITMYKNIDIQEINYVVK